MPHLLPVGTQVVSTVEVRGTDGKVVHPKGAVGVVTQSPADYWHSYRVRFLDGFEVSLKRNELAVLSQFQSAPTAAEHNLADHIIYRCVIGSRAYGLDQEGSDTDRRGVYLPPADLHWSLFGVPEQLEDQGSQECYWELQKFLTMALKANPNVLECLYSPMVEHATDLAKEMLAMRDQFLSKLVYQTYSGYVASQFKKMQADVRNRGEVKWKHVMHLLRLLLSGIFILKEGTVLVHVAENRERFLAIRRGEVPLDDIDDWRLELHRQFDAAYESSKLPDRPNYKAANDFLIEARLSMVKR